MRPAPEPTLKCRFPSASACSTRLRRAAAALVRDPDREWAPPNLDIAGEIEFLVNRELRAKGMTEVFDSPDVLVVYAVGVDMKALNVVDDPKDDSVQFDEVPKGGVVVILADPESLSVMWVGSAVAGEIKVNAAIRLDVLGQPRIEVLNQRRATRFAAG